MLQPRYCCGYGLRYSFDFRGKQQKQSADLEKAWHHLSSILHFIPDRWLRSVTRLTVCIMIPEKVSDLEWRRLQVHEQQSERAKKSPIQKTVDFRQEGPAETASGTGWDLSIFF